MEINFNNRLIELNTEKDYFAMLMEHRKKFNKNPLYYSSWPSGSFISNFKIWMLENNLIDEDLYNRIKSNNDMEDLFYSSCGIYRYYNVKDTEVKSCQVLCDYLISRLDGVSRLYEFLIERNSPCYVKNKRNEKYKDVSSSFFIITDEEKKRYDELYDKYKKLTFKEAEELAKINEKV